MLDEQGEWLPAGRFLPIAERLKLTSRLDLSAIALGLADLAANPAVTGLAVNLSASSLQDRAFRGELSGLLRQNAQAARRLWLEVAESGALKHFDAFRDLCRELKRSGCRVGIEHFGRQFSQVGQLHGLGIDYIKVDASFVRELDKNPGNQAFLKGLCAIVHGIGIQVIAEGVECRRSPAWDSMAPPARRSGSRPPEVVPGRAGPGRQPLRRAAPCCGD